MLWMKEGRADLELVKISAIGSRAGCHRCTSYCQIASHPCNNPCSSQPCHQQHLLIFVMMSTLGFFCITQYYLAFTTAPKRSATTRQNP